MLELISVVGVDEHTDLGKLDEQDQELFQGIGSLFPIEYGFLYSETRSQTKDDRYPSYKFIMDARQKLWQDGMLTSIHLCGSEAVEGYLKGDKYILDLIGPSRVQLNFNMAKYDADDLVAKVIKASERHMGHLILQQNKSKAEFITKVLREYHYQRDLNIDVLYDGSGGFGREIEKVEQPFSTFFTGYAGGLKPGNIKKVLELIDAVNVNNVGFYIDMESGVRTDNKFDLEKVKAVVTEVIDFHKEDEKDGE